MEAAAAKMAGELAEYKAESRELRNQEHTIRRLEEKARSLEAQLENKASFAASWPCHALPWYGI
jgi:homeobox protein cut-like